MRGDFSKIGIFTDDTVLRLGSNKQVAPATTRAGFTIKSVDEMEQVVCGEVYAPYVIDSHGDMMLPVDIAKLAHRHLIALKNHHVDLQHNNKPVEASVVESFIARANDPDYTEGAWVMAVKIFDANIWQDILDGKFNGYSLEAMVYKEEADVVYDHLGVHFGMVEANDGHFHSFFVEVDKDGRVIAGTTSEDVDGSGNLHSHKIHAGTATEQGNSHSHRFFLNEMDT